MGESNNDSDSGEKEEYPQCSENILLMGNMNQKMISLVTINAQSPSEKRKLGQDFTKAIPILRDHIFTIDILPFLSHPLNTRFHMARVPLFESPANYTLEM